MLLEMIYIAVSIAGSLAMEMLSYEKTEPPEKGRNHKEQNLPYIRKFSLRGIQFCPWKIDSRRE